MAYNLRDEQHPARRDTTPLPAGFRGQDVCSISIVGHGLLARYLLYGDCSCHLFARIACGTGEKVVGTHVARFAKLRPTLIIIQTRLSEKRPVSISIVRIIQNISQFLPAAQFFSTLRAHRERHLPILSRGSINIFLKIC